jgi:hypothetical protein
MDSDPSPVILSANEHLILNLPSIPWNANVRVRSIPCRDRRHYQILQAMKTHYYILKRSDRDGQSDRIHSRQFARETAAQLKKWFGWKVRILKITEEVVR